MIKEEKTLVFLWNYLEWGGAQIYFLAIIKEAVKTWRIKVLLPRKSSPDIVGFIRQTGAEYEFIDTWLDDSPAPGILKKVKRQWRRIHAEARGLLYLLKYPAETTVYHVEAAPWQSWIFLALLALRRDVFVTVHNAPVRSSRWREVIWKRRLRFLSGFEKLHFLTANREAKEVLKEFVTKSRADKIKVTYASIDPDQIEKVLRVPVPKKGLFAKLSIPDDKFTVLCVGQFVDRKGRWIFLAAAERLIREFPDLIFVWLMPKLPDQAAQAKIKSYDLRSSFYPVLSSNVGETRHEILAFISTADLFVLPSLIEGLPISLLEAMALKKACISTNINSIPEAVSHLENGWLIEPGRADELTGAISALRKDPATTDRLARNAQKFAVKNFDERKMAQQVIQEYENCLKKKS